MTARLAAKNGVGRTIRRNAELSLSELAAVVGVDPSTLGRWEHGATRPRGDLAIRYHDILSSLAVERALPSLDELIKEHESTSVAYLAAPKTTAEADLEMACGLVEDAFPHLMVKDGVRAFPDNEEWRFFWPILLRSRVEVVVVLPPEDGIVGAGVYREVRDAEKRDIDVLYLVDGDFVEPDRVELVKVASYEFSPARAYEVKVEVGTDE